MLVKTIQNCPGEGQLEVPAAACPVLLLCSSFVSFAQTASTIFFLFPHPLFFSSENILVCPFFSAWLWRKKTKNRMDQNNLFHCNKVVKYCKSENRCAFSQKCWLGLFLKWTLHAQTRNSSMRPFVFILTMSYMTSCAIFVLTAISLSCIYFFAVRAILWNVSASDWRSVLPWA